MVAKLLDHFQGTSMDAYAKLTDRQILDLYFHKRDEHGDIEPEKKPIEAPADQPPCLERELRSLDVLAATFRLPAEQVEEARAKLRAKYATMSQAQETPSPEASTNG